MIVDEESRLLACSCPCTFTLCDCLFARSFPHCTYPDCLQRKKTTQIAVTHCTKPATTKPTMAASTTPLPPDLAITDRSRKFHDGTYKWDAEGFTDEHGGKWRE